MKHTITNIIPPRPGSRVGTVVFDQGAPVLSVTVDYHWLVSTHARIGGQVTFMEDALRYHWEDLPEDQQKHGFMDELFPGVTRMMLKRYLEDE